MWIVETVAQPKLGNAEEEYEDACACGSGRFAMADGASESSFADRWARLLTSAFVEKPFAISSDGSNLTEWLEPLRIRWSATIDWGSLPWYAARKAEAGAFCSLLGLEFEAAENDLIWRACAIGDSCLFQIRDGQLHTAFPLSQAVEFGNRPFLISSKRSSDNGLTTAYRSVEGTVNWNDEFLLATDALAHWLLREHERGSEPWGAIRETVKSGKFEQFLADLRNTNAIRNDDTTLLSVRILDDELSETQ